MCYVFFKKYVYFIHILTTWDKLSLFKESKNSTKKIQIIEFLETRLIILKNFEFSRITNCNTNFAKIFIIKFFHLHSYFVNTNFVVS